MIENLSDIELDLLQAQYQKLKGSQTITSSASGK